MNREFRQKIVMGVLVCVFLCCAGIASLTLISSNDGRVSPLVATTMAEELEEE